MWRLILQVEAENQFLGSISLKYGVSFSGYPLSYWKDKKYLYVVIAGTVLGEEKNKNLLFKDIKKIKGIVHFERSENFAILVAKQPLYSEPLYNPKVIRPNPVIINSEGHHIWDLASFDRSTLEQILVFAKKHLECKIIRFKNEKISNITFTRLLSELSNKQKTAMDLAINHGYYEYPKKINLEKLAKIMGISYSTYQAHLKKAEGKIIPAGYKISCL